MMIAVMATAITMSNIVTVIGWRAQKKGRPDGTGAAKFTRCRTAPFDIEEAVLASFGSS